MINVVLWINEWSYNILCHIVKVDHLNVGVAQAYLNQKRLDLEAKNLNTNANNFHKQTTQWMSLIENFTSSLKVIIVYDIAIGVFINHISLPIHRN